LPNTADTQAARLVLGTAQLGVDYGIANRTGQPGQGEADDILQTAWSAGVRTLDTAQAYGNSEGVIGHFLKANPQCPFNVITKLTSDIDPADPKMIRTAVANSLARLGRKPAGLLLHSGKLLDVWSGPLGDTLTELKRYGEIGELGISVYEPEEFLHALSIPEITLIQAPFNVLDKRFMETGLLNRAKQKNRRLFLRSSFLQGFLTLGVDDLPPQMDFARKTLKGWRDLLEQFQLMPTMAALKFVLQAAPEIEVVIGCETATQLQEIIGHINGPDLSPDILSVISALPSAPDRLLNPSKWEIH